MNEVVNSATRQSDSTNAIIDFIVETVKAKSHKAISRDTAKMVYRGIFEKVFAETKVQGYFKLPWGFGQFKIVVIGLNAKDRRLPNGRIVKRRPRATIRYDEGESVKELLGTKAPTRQRRPPRNSEVPSVE